MTTQPAQAETAGATTYERSTTGRGGRIIGRLSLNLVIIFLAVIWLIPTIGLLVNSLRPPESLTQSGWWTAIFSPAQLTLDNYAYVLNQPEMTTGFVNSLFISIPATIIPIMVAAFAAYAFAWMKFPGRDILFIVVVGLLVVPLQSTFIPILTLYGPKGLNIAGSFLAVWLAHTGYGLPFAIFLLRNFMGDLPKEVFESAAIDGANHVTSFFRLALPMTVPAIAALAIFQFLFVWNDLLVALIYIGAQNPDNKPLTIVVSNLVSSLGGGWQYLAAAAFVTMIVPLVVFLTLQRYFVRGIVGGSVKG